MTTYTVPKQKRAKRLTFAQKCYFFILRFAVAMGFVFTAIDGACREVYTWHYFAWLAISVTVLLGFAALIDRAEDNMKRR